MTFTNKLTHWKIPEKKNLDKFLIFYNLNESDLKMLLSLIESNSNSIFNLLFIQRLLNSMKKQNRIEEKVIQLVGIHQEDNQLYLTEEGKSFL